MGAHDPNGDIFVGHESCPKCGSSDALARYADGHGYCHSCSTYHRADSAVQDQPRSHNHEHGGKMNAALIQDGVVEALPKRGISDETCAKWGYKKGRFMGRPVQIATYFEGHDAVAQKVRFPDKDFKFLGDTKRAGLYGQHLWRDGGKHVVITEGELDALSVSQLQNNKWPVVSVPNGAQGAKKALARALEWLNGFDSVVLMFDNDAPGNAAVAECAPLFPPGKCKVARLPLKDANEMLLAGRGAEVIDAVWGAKVYRPDGIVTLGDIRSDVLKAPEQGLSWWSPTLTELTYGRRAGEVYTFGAGTGIGKTDFLTQQVVHDLTVLNEKVGLFFMEQEPAETAKRIAGKVGKKCFHIPDGTWTQAELIAALDKLEGDRLFLFNHFGTCEWENIRERIRFLYHSEGVRLFYLDHLTALAAEAEDERKALEAIMAQVGSLVKELKIVLHLVSHLATPEGRSHEEGGRVMARHFKGSRSIGFWSHYMVGFERDQQNEDVRIRTTTTVRVLKDRYTGRANGKVFYMAYDSDTGTLYETEAPEEQDNPAPGSDGKDDF